MMRYYDIKDTSKFQILIMDIERRKKWHHASRLDYAYHEQYNQVH